MPGRPFQVYDRPSITVTALEVAHGTVPGSVVYAADIDRHDGSPRKGVVFLWDIDVPGASRPSDGMTNIDVIKEDLRALEGADLLLVAANTYRAALGVTRGTGHTSYLLARDYVDTIGAKTVMLTHLSGHEDEDTNTGFGWNDEEWQSHVAGDGVGVARQGMFIAL